MSTLEQPLCSPCANATVWPAERGSEHQQCVGGRPIYMPGAPAHQPPILTECCGCQCRQDAATPPGR